MGIEVLLAYLLLMLLLGPGTMAYGITIVVRRRAPLFRGKVLLGGAAVIAGTVTILAGLSFSYG